MHLRFFASCLVFVPATALRLWAMPTPVLDSVVLGDVASEQRHALQAQASETLKGGLGEPGRRLLPLSPVSHNGGSLRFQLQVDPERQNYVTVKLWGGDAGVEHGRLVLYVDGKQVGYRHEGDQDLLNQCDAEPLWSGRFVYQTVSLPLAATQGRTQVELRLAGLGAMWPYGATFAQKQKLLSSPSRSLYRVYSHTEPCFEPGAEEQQGTPPADRLRPRGEGEALFPRFCELVNKRLDKMLAEPGGRSGDIKELEAKILLLAQAYGRPWTQAYHDPRTLEAIVQLGDGFLQPKIVGSNWLGAGPLGEALMRVGLQPELTKALEQTLEVPAGFPSLGAQSDLKPMPAGIALERTLAPTRMTRREAWARVLRVSVDWTRLYGRRYYTNQSMIVDRNLYTANRGLQLIAPERALPETQARRYVYEAVGLLPWLGNDLPEGGSEKPFGEHYFQVTRKGLTRELGYVGTYGETILLFCRDLYELTGDPNLREQLLKLQAARMPFRYPAVDGEGYRVMRLASEIDNRTAHYPLELGAYGVANIRESWWMELAATLQDPRSLGAARLSLADNQYFHRLESRLGDPDTLGMMNNVDYYATVRRLPEQETTPLPMLAGQPDFVFSDEEDAVVALKHGEERLYVNFYYRQEFGVSGAVRVLDLQPSLLRLATVKAGTVVDGCGQDYVRPDYVDFERSGGMPPPKENLHQAFAGEKLPIARRPEGARQPAYGTWGPFVGKASFYWLRYGSYLIALNTSETVTYPLEIPASHAQGRDLVSGRQLHGESQLQVGPLSTVVILAE